MTAEAAVDTDDEKAALRFQYSAEDIAGRIGLPERDAISRPRPLRKHACSAIQATTHGSATENSSRGYRGSVSLSNRRSDLGSSVAPSPNQGLLR